MGDLLFHHAGKTLKASKAVVNTGIRDLQSMNEYKQNTDTATAVFARKKNPQKPTANNINIY